MAKIVGLPDSTDDAQFEAAGLYAGTRQQCNKCKCVFIVDVEDNYMSHPARSEVLFSNRGYDIDGDVYSTTCPNCGIQVVLRPCYYLTEDWWIKDPENLGCELDRLSSEEVE